MVTAKMNAEDNWFTKIFNKDKNQLSTEMNNLIHNEEIKKLFDISYNRKDNSVIFRRFINSVTRPLSINERKTSKFTFINSFKVAEWSINVHKLRFCVMEYNTRSTKHDLEYNLDKLVDYTKTLSSYYEFPSINEFFINLLNESSRLNPNVDFKSIFNPLTSLVPNKRIFTEQQEKYNEVMTKLIKKYNKIPSNINDNDVSIPRYSFGILNDIFAINPSLLDACPFGLIELDLGFVDSEYNLNIYKFENDYDKNLLSANPTFYRKSFNKYAGYIDRDYSYIRIDTRPELLISFFEPDAASLVKSKIIDNTNMYSSQAITIEQDTEINFRLFKDQNNWFDAITGALDVTLAYLDQYIEKDDDKKSKAYNNKLHKAIEKLIVDIKKWSK